MSRSIRQASKPTTRAVWLCGLLLVLAGLSRQFVLCTHLDGDTHVEFAHPEGACCEHREFVQEGEPEGDGGAAPHDSCSHFLFAIDIAPSPRADAPVAPQHDPAASQPIPVAGTPAPRHAAPPLPPPATGPPRPRPFLRLLRSTRLTL